MASSMVSDPQLDPARGYRAFEEFLQPVERVTMSVAPALGGYSHEVVGLRLMQRIVELAVYPYIQAAAASHARGAALPTPAAGSLKLGGLRFRDNRVTVTPATWMRGVVDFCIQWIRVIACIAGAGRDAIPVRATLLMGVGLADLTVDGSDARFIDFCRRGPLPPLRDATHLVVESTQRLTSSQPARVSYARQPLLALLRAHPPRGRDLLQFFGTHLAAAAAFFRHSFFCPLACLLARDLAFHAAAAALNQRGSLEAIVITNSYFQTQPLWMRALAARRFETHMVWYSQNTIPFVFRPDGTRSDLPHYRHMAVDAHWVWTEGYATYVRALDTGAKVHVVGPILWRLPEAAAPAASTLSIAIFDVTPMHEDIAQKIGLPRNYYATVNMIAFLEQATSACERIATQLGRRVEVVLKHKRTHSDIHDTRYIEFVDRLATAGRIRLVSPQANLYSLIAASTAIIVVPYSSPAYVASALGIPAIYLDATDSIEATHEPAPFVDFASGEVVLAEKLSTALLAHGREVCHA
ncbi:MAG: polysaccharide biosynthesis PFTS motif protein [Burkholderiales bacterium]